MASSIGIMRADIVYGEGLFLVSKCNDSVSNMLYLFPATGFKILKDWFEEEAKIFWAHDIPDWECWEYNVHCILSVKSSFMLYISNECCKTLG